MNSDQSTKIVEKVSPFGGEPFTVQRVSSDGTPLFEILIDELTPLRAKFVDELTAFCTVIFGIICLYGLYQTKPESGLIWFAGFCVPPLSFVLLEWLFIILLSKKTNVVLTPSEFRVEVNKQWLVYDRTLTHRFVMMRHDEARAEMEKHDLEIRRAANSGRIINKKRYYAESFHIVFEYVGHRHDIAEVYDRNRATAIIARLKACDEVMNNIAKLGDGEALGPEDQWGEQPGDLP